MILKEQHCKQLEGSEMPLGNDQLDTYLEQLSSGWEVLDNKELHKEFPFENFKRGMTFAQSLALLAEEEQHHPQLCVDFNRVIVKFTTHDIGGLSINDFIMAARTDDL